MDWPVWVVDVAQIRNGEASPCRTLFNEIQARLPVGERKLSKLRALRDGLAWPVTIDPSNDERFSRVCRLSKLREDTPRAWTIDFVLEAHGSQLLEFEQIDGSFVVFHVPLTSPTTIPDRLLAPLIEGGEPVKAGLCGGIVAFQVRDWESKQLVFAGAEAPDAADVGQSFVDSPSREKFWVRDLTSGAPLLVSCDDRESFGPLLVGLAAKLGASPPV